MFPISGLQFRSFFNGGQEVARAGRKQAGVRPSLARNLIIPILPLAFTEYRSSIIGRQCRRGTPNGSTLPMIMATDAG